METGCEPFRSIQLVSFLVDMDGIFVSRMAVGGLERKKRRWWLQVESERKVWREGRRRQPTSFGQTKVNRQGEVRSLDVDQTLKDQRASIYGRSSPMLTTVAYYPSTETLAVVVLYTDKGPEIK